MSIFTRKCYNFILNLTGIHSFSFQNLDISNKAPESYKFSNTKCKLSCEIALGKVPRMQTQRNFNTISQFQALYDTQAG